MSQFLIAAIYVLAESLGAYAHWFKKKFADETTRDTLTK
jgi:hypothetical protein